MLDEKDTIAAISTPVGEGGIGVIRISGKGAEAIGKKILRKPNGDAWGPLEERRVYFGKLIDQTGQTLDEVIF